MIEINLIPHKTCTKCKRNKPLGGFSRHSGGKFYTRSECTDCCVARVQKWKKANPEKNREYNLRRNWAIGGVNCTVEQYNEMQRVQGGRCAICDGPPGKNGLHVDHDHKTLKVRAPLCVKCNPGLGQFQDRPSLLIKAADYIRKHRK